MWVAVLLACRLAPLVWLVPVFVPDKAPATVRVAVLLACVAMLWPLVPVPPSVDMLTVVDLALLALKEGLVGASLAVVVGSVFWGAEVAGVLVMAGARSPAASVDRRGSFQEWLPMMGAAIFVASGGHLLLLGALAASVEAVPLWGDVQSVDWRAGALVVVAQAGQMLTLGLVLALPVLAARWAAQALLLAAQKVAPRWQAVWGSVSLRAWWTLLVILLLARVMADVLWTGSVDALSGWTRALGWL